MALILPLRTTSRQRTSSKVSQTRSMTPPTTCGSETYRVDRRRDPTPNNTDRGVAGARIGVSKGRLKKAHPGREARLHPSPKASVSQKDGGSWKFALGTLRTTGCRRELPEFRTDAHASSGILTSSLGRSATTALMRSTRRFSKPSVSAVKTVVHT
jgi:hypothetical protein